MIIYLIYLILSFFLFLLGLYCCAVLVKKGKLPHIQPLAAYLGLNLLWIVIDTIQAFAFTETALRLLNSVGNILGVLTVGAFFLFLHQYLTQGEKFKLLFYSLIGIASFFLILRFTNPIHSLYYREIGYREVGPYLQFAPLVGPAYNLLIAFSAIIDIYALFYVMTRKAAYQRVFYQQLMLTLYSAVPMLVYGMLTALNLSLIRVPIMAQMAIIPGIAFCLYTFQHHLLALHPIAFENALEGIGDGILSFGGEGTIVDLNEQMCTILQKPWKKLAGTPLQKSFPELYSKLEETGLFPTDQKDARQTVYHIVLYVDEKGYDTTVYFTNRYIKVTMHDVTNLLKEMQTTSTLAAIDPLTGIFNRRHSERTIKERLLAKQYGDVPYCFIVFDIDYFKQINDNYGHQTGDRILKEITQIFIQSIRPIDVFGRYGGDEFILLLHQVVPNQAKVILDRIQMNIKAHAFVSEDGEAIRPTISVGAITATTASEVPYNELFFMADEALYHAKEKGRDQIVVRQHTPFMKATYL